MCGHTELGDYTMYRTMFASLRVPDIDDTNQAEGLLNLSTDIQYCTARNEARLKELERRRGAHVSTSASSVIPLPNGIFVTIPWDTVTYDSDNYVDLSVSTTNIVVPKGVFIVSGSGHTSGTGIVNTAWISISGSVYGTIASNQCGPFASSRSVLISLVGIFYSVAGENVTMRFMQTSGAAASLSTSNLSIAKIGNL